MPYCRPLVVIAFAAIMALVLGCSSGNTPIAPDNDLAGAMDKVPTIGLTNASGIIDGISMLGSYEFNLDAENMTADLVTQRSSAIGEDYIVSGLGFFTMAPCTNCLTMTGVVNEGGFIKISFSLNHPFAPGDPLKPATAKNRLDLNVFDTALVVVPSTGTAQNYTLTGASAYSTICANADGFTTELSALITDTAACPYFLVIDDSTTGTATNNKLAMGATNVLFDVYFNAGGNFNMYLTMGYGASAKKAQRLSPKYYLPEFNRKAPWKVAVVLPNGANPPARGNTWDDNDNTAEYTVAVKVYDWQQSAVVTSDPATYADEADTTKVYAASTVSNVSMEIPGMYSTLKEKAVADSGLGTPADPLVYNFAVANENDLGAGTYYGLVEVTDTRPVLTPTDGRDFLIDTPNGIALNNYAIPAYITYQVFPAVVVVGCGPITGSITYPVCPVATGYTGQSMSFTALADSANGGNPITLYEWDMDYDGTTFDVDGTGATTTLGPFDNPNCGGTNEPVTFTVAVRATDSCVPPNTTLIGTCEVTIDICEGAPVNPIQLEPKVTGDTWYDIGVAMDGPVYVVADHPATGNVTSTRTALQYQNDLTSMVVINSGTGMNDPEGLGGTQYWNRIDVTQGNYLITNPRWINVITWSVSGSSATTCYGGNCISCGTYTCAGFFDVWHVVDATYGSNGISATTTTDCGSPAYFGTIKRPDGGTVGSFGGLTNPPLYDQAQIVGASGYEGTQNTIYFFSSATEGKVTVSGSWLDGAFYTAAEVDTVGTLGTADGEFTGGLDVTSDSANNVLTLENYATGVYRFQKFDSNLDWIYTSPWIGTGNPQRMDFDIADDMLYVLSDAGITICTVE